MLKYLFLAVLAFSFACKSKPKQKATPQAETKNTVVSKAKIAFNADSAYAFVEQQVAFGPRVPGSEAHTKCAQYLETKLKKYGFVTEIQTANIKGFKTTYNMLNVIGKLNPNVENRVLLCAHWDTRFVADYDTDKNKQHTPILGANDGASGVGVILELARIFQKQQPNIGIDIVLFDIEDQGIPRFEKNRGTADFWCLGSKYWAKQEKDNPNKADYGILLDMVGAPNARFHFEHHSVQYASFVLNKVWEQAAKSGYAEYFIREKGGYITDDHVPVNQIANIPCIDIIQYDENSQTGFGYYWHTHMDNMSSIDKQTLKAVGQTIADVIYSE